ncbi:zonadhesin [Pieris rapae]|uniref:zonadhesin n=1 Tax=Pieris rapae TaxID=64459 RepID=UPI001E281643|nr:zonadhesin [Pieris rapae]
MLKLLVISVAIECVIVVSGSERCNGHHEYYEKCIKTCDPQTCENAGETFHCPMKSKCKGGCRCKRGYLRNENKECIRSDRCDDKNYEISYSYNTPTSKHTVEKSGKESHKHSKGSSSFLSEKDSSISSISQTPSTRHTYCGRHEVWSECTNGGCGRRTCSDLASPVICIDPAKGHCRSGCVCKENYLRNRYGLCVPISKCPTPKCQEHEVYLRNRETVNHPQTCWQYLYANLDDSVQTQGPECICRKNYARNNDGQCIPVSNCFHNIRGKRSICRSNEEFVLNTAGISRPQSCWRYILGFPKSKEPLFKPGCVCIENYVRNSTGSCIPTKQCRDLMLTVNSTMLNLHNIVILVCVTSVICNGHPEFCGPNEVIDDCVNGGCGRRNCSDLAEPQLCIDPIHCIRGCRCRDGYLRDEYGGCVPVTSCPIPNCKEGEIFDFCPGYCQPECGVDQSLILCKPSPQPGDADCDPACRCADGLYRTTEGTCVPKESCPPKCPNGEVYEECPDPCVPNTCASIWSRFIPCPPRPEDCKPTCRCPDGLHRNKIGQCITTEECLQCRGPNEYFSCGGACDNECDKLSRQSINNCPIINIQCNRKCYCEDGYARDANNTCIPINECPPECPINERYVNNINEICEAKTCSELDQPLPCQVDGSCNTGPPGCICIDGYVRNGDGICVPTYECPPKCPNGEVYEKCPDPCVPNTCEVIYSTYKPCPPRPEDCKPTCLCPDGQFRNKIGQCITSEECLQCNGPHEYFSCGGACDNECDKLSRQSINNCPIVNIQCNRKCYCEDGYARDANNTCIPINECPPECPINERYVNNINEICVAKTCSELDQPLPCQIDGSCNTGPPGCICIDGYVRNGDGICVPTTECPPKCPNGEVYEKCPDPCVPNTCASIWSRFKPCPPQPEDCKPTCRCPDGQYRNKIGQCITTEECLQCRGPNEYFSCGGACDNECDKLSRQSIKHCPIVNIQCNRKCYCEDGYARNANNTCIPINECPPECPVNEQYVKNVNEICRAKTCSELGEPLPCLQEGYDDSGPPGCICNDGFIRNCDGLCVPTTECPACGGDYNATTGPGTFCITCDNYKIEEQVVCILVSKINGCACRDKYVYNNHLKQCILPQDCHLDENLCGFEHIDYHLSFIMSKYFFALLLSGLICIINCESSSSSDESDEQQRLRSNFDQGNDDFTAHFLYDVIDEKPNKSVITSPFSLLFLLSQLALYSKGKTYDQLAKLLNLNKRNDIRSTIPQYLDEINSQRNVNFSLAERVFGSIDYPFSKAFKRDTKLTFHAQARNLDFSEPEEAAKEINSWIASQTNNLIKDLISPSALDEDTRLVLTNAIYFKGDWKSPFNSKKTRPQTFHITHRRKTSVKMMNQIGHFNYGYIKNIQAKVVQMFYKNENFSFLTILPNKKHSVHSVADQLQDLDLQYDVINNLDSARVNISIPVIHTESKTDLADILKKNGVTALFNSSSSDLSGILMYPEPLYVSSAIQKAKIIVNEAGSEAAAANAITVGTTAAEAKPEQFHANHPFLYYIMYKDTAIFAGHYAGAQ